MVHVMYYYQCECHGQLLCVFQDVAPANLMFTVITRIGKIIISTQLTGRSAAGYTRTKMMFRTINLLVFILFCMRGGVQGFYRAHTKYLPRGWGLHNR